MTDTNDNQWMQLALELAARGIGSTHPNPRVGAVVVKDDVCIGRGWHEKAGEAHAEVHALQQAGADAKGASLYVTLEPCNATGRTPPCTQAILRAGIKRVVFASHDPNPTMQGGGVFLRQQGLDVHDGILKAQADTLNAPFFRFLRTGLPYVIAKAAISIDGKLATYHKDSQWISGEESRRHAHQLRASVDAIIVGRHTFEHDNPTLNIRHVPCSHTPPLRVVIATNAPSFRQDCHFLQAHANAGAIRFYLKQTGRDDASWQAAGVEIVYLQTLEDLFRHLAAQGALSVLVEGGGGLHASVFEAELAQECVLYQAPILVGGKKAPGLWHGKGIQYIKQTPHLHILERRMLGDDQLIRGMLIYREASE